MQLALDVMPFLIMAAVTAAAVVTRGEVSVLSLLSLGPAFAAVAGGLRHTLITGFVALALCAALATYQSLAVSRLDSLPFATVAGVTLAAVIASAGRQRRERELADVKAIAEATQQVLLRPVPQRLGDVRLAVRYMSAASGARIGGDLYDVVITRGRLRLIIGDVQGKGLPSVQTAATVLAAFREAAHDAPSLTVITDRIEDSLARDSDREQFVTAILAEVSADGSTIELLNCGHPPPLLAGGDAPRFVEPADPGLPLGLADLARLPRHPEPVGFGPGGALLLYTDGISEARDRHGAFFPLTAADRVLLAAGPDALLERLSADVIRHVGHALDDDAAMLLLQRDPVAQSRTAPSQPAVPSSRAPW
jgi:serine phosphatase RsbU (regulator of sigma subunit)